MEPWMKGVWVKWRQPDLAASPLLRTVKVNHQDCRSPVMTWQRYVIFPLLERLAGAALKIDVGMHEGTRA
jgi:hypothetical protein